MELIVFTTDYVEDRQGACSFHTAKDRIRTKQQSLILSSCTVLFNLTILKIELLLTCTTPKENFAREK